MDDTPVIAVINRKGGIGKSTISTHLAAWMALPRLASGRCQLGVVGMRIDVRSLDSGQTIFDMRHARQP